MPLFIFGFVSCAITILFFDARPAAKEATTRGKAIWRVKDPSRVVDGKLQIDLADGRAIMVDVNKNGFFVTDEIPPPEAAIYFTSAPR